MCVCVSSGTGNTVIEAVKVLIEHGVQPRHIILLSLFSTPHGTTNTTGRPATNLLLFTQPALTASLPASPATHFLLRRHRQVQKGHQLITTLFGAAVVLTRHFRQQSSFFLISTDTKLQMSLLLCWLIVLPLTGRWALKVQDKFPPWGGGGQ